MQTILRIVLLLLSVAFIGIGLLFMFYPAPLLEMWAQDPANAANPALAWSTVRSDLGALFLTFAVALGLGALNDNKTWLSAAMLLMGLVFVGRAVGLAINGGDPQIYTNMAVEAIIVILIWLYKRQFD